MCGRVGTGTAAACAASGAAADCFIFLLFLKRQQVKHEGSIDCRVSVILLDAPLIAAGVVNERALEVEALAVGFPFLLEDRACQSQRFLVACGREIVDFLKNL